MRIRWTESAARALENIQDYIARDNPRVAFEFAHWIRVAVSQLEEHPTIGRTRRVRGTLRAGHIWLAIYRAVSYQKERDTDSERVSRVKKMAGY